MSLECIPGLSKYETALQAWRRTESRTYLPKVVSIKLAIDDILPESQRCESSKITGVDVCVET